MSWTTPTYIQFLYKQPPLSYVTNLFTLPFSRTVWLSIAGLFFLGVMFIYFITVWERRNMEDRQNATEPVRKAIYEKKIKPKGDKIFMTLEEGVKRIREGFFAFHGETPPMYTVIGETFYESEKCSLQNIQYIEASQFWLPCKKKSSYKEIFKVCLRKLAEFGIQSRESSRLFDPMPKCLGGGGNFVSVGLVDAGPAFAFLGAGFAVAISLFLFEYAVHRFTCCRLTHFRKKSR